MGVIITIVIALIVWTVIRFLMASKKQSDSIIREGGIRQKYSIIVDRLFSADPSSRIVDESNTGIVIGCAGSSGSTYYELIPTFSTLTILMHVDNMIFGKHKLEMEFPADMDQYEIIRRMNEQVREFNVKIIQQKLQV